MKLPFAPIVPVYNPEPGLETLCKSLEERFETVVVVDDGSVEEVEVFARLPQAVTLLRHPANAGKGRAMKTALAWLRENRPGVAGVVFADGDGQHRIGDVAAVAQRSLETGRVVFGVRDFSAKGVPFRSWWGNRWTAAEVWLLFGFRLADTQTGLRAVPRRLWDALLSLGGERFEYEAGWFGCLKRREESILEVPIETVYRAGNRASHFRPLKDTLLTQGALFISSKHKESTNMNIKATLALGTAFGMLSGFGAIRAVTPDQWGGAAKGWQMQRHNEKMGVVTNGGAKVVFIGDSITHNWEGPGKESLAELRKTYSVLDIGYSGDQTEHLVWRGENGELDGYKAKCIMLMIGTNNTWHRNDRPEAIAAGIRKILAVIAKKQPQAKVLLLPIFPFGDKPDHPNRVNNEKVNEMIKCFADGQKVIWVDFNAKFLDEKGDTAKWMPDHCHPNAAGYREIWLPAVLPYFREIVGK